MPASSSCISSLREPLGTFAQTRADTYTWACRTSRGTRYADIAVSEEWVTLDIPLELNDDVLVGFLLETQGAVQIRNSYYYTEVNDENIRPVELALCTTTFKNENYILPNVELVRKRIIETDEPISGHFSMHVVDNGRTLDAKDVESERIFLHPNPNAVERRFCPRHDRGHGTGPARHPRAAYGR